MGEALSANNTTSENGQTGTLIGKTNNLVMVPPNGHPDMVLVKIMYRCVR